MPAGPVAYGSRPLIVSPSMAALEDHAWQSDPSRRRPPAEPRAGAWAEACWRNVQPQPGMLLIATLRPLLRLLRTVWHLEGDDPRHQSGRPLPRPWSWWGYARTTHVHAPGRSARSSASREAHCQVRGRSRCGGKRLRESVVDVRGDTLPVALHARVGRGGPGLSATRMVSAYTMCPCTHQALQSLSRPVRHLASGISDSSPPPVRAG